MTTDFITWLAILGAGGQFGKCITQALIEQGKHQITAITRASSNAVIPAGVHSTKKVDYDSPSSLVDALRGRDALIVTMAATSGPEIQM